MKSPSSSFLAVVLLTVTVVLQQQVSAYEFDHDADTELCKATILDGGNVCTSNATMWFSCPISCSDYLYGGYGTMAEERSEPEQFFELNVQKVPVAADANINRGEDMSLEDNEGYITLYAVVPMKPGIGKYYYEAIEHIAHVFKYTVVAMILPYYDTRKENGALFFPDGSSSVSIANRIIKSRSPGKTKSILLTGYDVRQNPDNKVLEYLLSRDVVAGKMHPEVIEGNIEDDKLLAAGPNIFLVSQTGMYVERMVTPTIELLERRIKVHELALEHELRFNNEDKAEL